MGECLAKIVEQCEVRVVRAMRSQQLAAQSVSILINPIMRMLVCGRVERILGAFDRIAFQVEPMLIVASRPRLQDECKCRLLESADAIVACCCC